jgi:Xaa-Pro aminopeptidase
MKYTAINSQLFIDNRKKFIAELPPNSMAILLASDEMPRSADQAFVFRQNPDLFG